MVSSKTQGRGGGGGGYFSYILLNEIPLKEIQTMFLQLAKLSGRVLPADLCTDHARYLRQKPLINGFERKSLNKNDRDEVL